MAPTIKFEDLNDDCISLVIEEAARLPASDAYAKLRVVKNLSLVNKRVRFLCCLVLYKTRRLCLFSEGNVKPTVETFGALIKTGLVSFPFK